MQREMRSMLLPVARELGIDPFHFAAIVGTNLGLGNGTLPCAPCFTSQAVSAGCNCASFVFHALRPIVFGHLQVVLLVTYIPAVS